MPKNPVTGKEMAIHPERLNPVPAAAGFNFDAVLDISGPLKLPKFPQKGRLARGR